MWEEKRGEEKKKRKIAYMITKPARMQRSHMQTSIQTPCSTSASIACVAARVKIECGLREKKEDCWCLRNESYVRGFTPMRHIKHSTCRGSTYSTTAFLPFQGVSVVVVVWIYHFRLLTSTTTTGTITNAFIPFTMFFLFLLPLLVPLERAWLGLFRCVTHNMNDQKWQRLNMKTTTHSALWK